MMPAKKTWWVAGIAYPAAPDTAVPFYFQADSEASAEKFIGGKPLAGPFATEAEAVAWATGPGKNLFGKGKTNIAPPAAPNAARVPVPKVPGLPNPLSWLAGISHWIGEAVAHILDAAMWRSILWVALGAVLMIAGLFLWLKQQGLAPKAAPVPVPV